MTQEPYLLTRKLAATNLSISTRAVDYLVSRGELKTIRIGGRNLIPTTEVKRLARRGMVGNITGQR